MARMRQSVRQPRESAVLPRLELRTGPGIHEALNPCQGIRGFREDGRDAYVDDELTAKVMERAVRPLQFALRLAHLAGQRPGNVPRMSEADISGGVLRVQPSR
jgi:hypothetical protein